MRLNISPIILVISTFPLYHCCAGASGDFKSINHENRLVVTGTQLHQRSRFDSGDIQIFLRNVGKTAMSITNCILVGSITSQNKEQNKINSEIDYLYFKLSPPVLMPGENGELSIKLIKYPPTQLRLKCVLYDNTGQVTETQISEEQVPVWIPSVGFSEDLKKIYVYVQNNGSTTLNVRLRQVADINIENNHQQANLKLAPNDKSCLIFEAPVPFNFGEYVHVAVSAEDNEQQWWTQAVIRAINEFPILSEHSRGDPALKQDSQGSFIQIMHCPAHAHGPHKNAAAKFLHKRFGIFSQKPWQPVQMKICRAGMLRAWYRFGSLPDIAVMNIVLPTGSDYKFDAQSPQRFNPFFWLASNAKNTAAPNRFLACLPIQPENRVFIRNSHTPDEIRFLVYCAISAGAKGILYRDIPPSNPLNLNAFIRLNEEMQQLKPLLITAEPVDWVSTANDDYIAKSLLCGDETIIVFVLDRRYLSMLYENKRYTPAFEKTLKQIKINVSIPSRLLIADMESLYETLPKGLWAFQDGSISFTADMLDSVEVYKIILSDKNSEDKVIRTSRKCSASQKSENSTSERLRKRLEVAHCVVELVSRAIESQQKRYLENAVGLDILPESGNTNEYRNNFLLLSPERLYWDNLKLFSGPLDTRKEANCPYEHYDTQMKKYIVKASEMVTQAINTSEVLCYSFILPLLYAQEDDIRWNEPDTLLMKIKPDYLDSMANFCLLRIERPKTAAAVARYNAELRNENFSDVRWLLKAGDKCVVNNRPDLAEELILSATDKISDGDKSVELRLRIVGNYEECGDIATAAKKCKQIAEDFPKSPFREKVIYTYFSYLAKQFKIQQILSEIDAVLESGQCRQYLPQLMYLKWWSLRKTSQHTAADEIAEKLMKKYQNSQVIAPLLLAQAVDEISSQNFSRCRKLLDKLLKDFPKSPAAEQARKILACMKENCPALDLEAQ